MKHNFGSRSYRYVAGFILLGIVMFNQAVRGQQPIPLGPESQINTFDWEMQRFPAVALEADGDFVVVWASDGSSGSDLSSYCILGRRFDSAGEPVGEEFQVNTYTTSSQSHPAVAAASDGGFVVVWHSDGSGGSDSSMSSIQGRRFDSAGEPVGDEFQVNTYTTDRQWHPSVAVDTDADFVVVWYSFGSSGSDWDASSIQGQRFDSAGEPVGDEFQVNTYTTKSQWGPTVAADADGDLVVVWASDGSSCCILGRRFDSAGEPVGEEFQVNTFTTRSQVWPEVVADADGHFVVVWQSDGSGGSDSSLSSIQGRSFDSAGEPVGEDFQINTYTTDRQSFPVVALGVDGNFVVVWESDGSSGSDTNWYSVQAQSFDSVGMPVGGEFQVNTYTPGFQGVPAVAADANGDLVVVWEGFRSSGEGFLSVHGQRFTTPIFVDSFESGDTTAWSNTVP